MQIIFITVLILFQRNFQIVMFRIFGTSEVIQKLLTSRFSLYYQKLTLTVK